MRAHAERGRDDRQPEVEDAVREHREHGGGERDAAPRERERQQRLDRAGAAERQRPPRQRVARRIAEQQERDVGRAVRERLQARPEADDVAEPVDGGAERPEQVLRLHEQALEHVDRVERLRQMPSRRPACARSAARCPTAQSAATKPSGTAIAHGSVSAERRRVRAVGEQQDRDDAGGRREQRVLERAEAEHAHAHLRSESPACLNAWRSTAKPPRATNAPKPAVTAATTLARPELAVVLDARHLAVAST